MSTQFQKPTHKLTTARSPYLRQGEYQVDHVAISRKNTKEILNVKSRKGTFESDHHLLQIKLKFQPNRRLKRPPKSIKPDPEYLKITAGLMLAVDPLKLAATVTLKVRGSRTVIVDAF